MHNPQHLFEPQVGVLFSPANGVGRCCRRSPWRAVALAKVAERRRPRLSEDTLGVAFRCRLRRRYGERRSETSTEDSPVAIRRSGMCLASLNRIFFAKAALPPLLPR
jgi:hypothetical protein